jgi:hypothetical protein
LRYCSSDGVRTRLVRGCDVGQRAAVEVTAGTSQLESFRSSCAKLRQRRDSVGLETNVVSSAGVSKAGASRVRYCSSDSGRSRVACCRKTISPRWKVLALGFPTGHLRRPSEVVEVDLKQRESGNYHIGNYQDMISSRFALLRSTLTTSDDLRRWFVRKPRARDFQRPISEDHPMSLRPIANSAKRGWKCDKDGNRKPRP